MKKTDQLNVRIAPDVKTMFIELCQIDNRSSSDELEYLIVTRLKQLKQEKK